MHRIFLLNSTLILVRNRTSGWATVYIFSLIASTPNGGQMIKLPGIISLLLFYLQRFNMKIMPFLIANCKCKLDTRTVKIS